MKRIPALLQCDFYKIGHVFQYEPGTIKIYTNLTPRNSRLEGIDKIVFFGLQYFVKEYLINQFNETFFFKSLRYVLEEYQQVIESGLGPNAITYNHIKSLHRLGYLPIEIKALPEGQLVDIKIPVLTIVNTKEEFYWLPNFLETILSTTLWQSITSATIAFEYRKILTTYANKTSDNLDFVLWQGHDFSMRGMSSLESACLSASGHLLSFLGTDTVPSLVFLSDYYNAKLSKELVGSSVPATEHSVMCLSKKDKEFETFKRLITEVYPTGIVSIVSDTWDLWTVLTDYLPRLKDVIEKRDGKIVIRPDSGDPVDIICGLENKYEVRNGEVYLWESDYKDYGSGQHRDISGYTRKSKKSIYEHKGVVEILYDIFGGTINTKGYIELPSYIGVIYGDSITLKRMENICNRLDKKRFASTNVVFGIGSYTYQYNTRDTFGLAMKATYGELLITEEKEKDHNGKFAPIQTVECRELFKDPITDSGIKRSAKGLLKVISIKKEGTDIHDHYELIDCVSWEEEKKSELKTVFKDGKLLVETSLLEIRQRINLQLSNLL